MTANNWLRLATALVLACVLGCGDSGSDSTDTGRGSDTGGSDTGTGTVDSHDSDIGTGGDTGSQTSSDSATHHATDTFEDTVTGTLENTASDIETNTGEDTITLSDTTSGTGTGPDTVTNSGSVTDSDSQTATETESSENACPNLPPGGATSEQGVALSTINAERAAMDIVCMDEVAALNLAATLHCTYYSSNTGSCIADPHTEVAGCNNFVAEDFWTRATSAGYTGSSAFENMAYSGNAHSAVQQWIHSVWHRTPLLSPWITQFGYGQSNNCDTADFGYGTGMPNATIAHYPYAGQTDVRRSFNGAQEGPTPPAPPGGWPSGYPITVFAKGIFLSHQITVDGSATPMAHQWIDGTNDTMGLLMGTAAVMYTNTGLSPNTSYRVIVTGTLTSGSTPFTVDFTFTTGS